MSFDELVEQYLQHIVSLKERAEITSYCHKFYLEGIRRGHIEKSQEIIRRETNNTKILGELNNTETLVDDRSRYDQSEIRP